MNARLELPTVTLTLDGQTVDAFAHETLLELCQRQGLELPHLCTTDGLDKVGNCRSCVVEINGERTLAPSCCRHPQAGMDIRTQSERAKRARQTVIELLGSEVSASTLQDDNELAYWHRNVGARPDRYAPRLPTRQDRSHPAITVDLNACIQCTRCVRACRDAQVNDVIGLAFRGSAVEISFDLNDPMGGSTCVACGECVQACPTGALRSSSTVDVPPPEREVNSLCPFCGVGCQVKYQVRGNTIQSVEGINGPANAGRLCVKGRYGFDYVHHRQRLTRPLIRKAGHPKDPEFAMDPDHWRDAFREASWEEALALAGQGLKRIRQSHGAHALAGFGSAKGSNEEAYLFQKLVRTGFGSNNVDHCTRLCHASSVAALLEGIGSGAVSNPVRDVEHAEVILVIGANPSVNHPVASSWIKNAARQGKTLIVADPRGSDLARHADWHLAFKADTDVALLNAMIHVIIQEDLVDHAFISARLEDYDSIVGNIAPYSPERMAPVCGIPPETIRTVARRFATAKSAMILWGMGVSQHIHGTDNARCLITLALICGHIGKPGTGLHPLRGQNNVQGASDAGLIPMMYPDYQRVDDLQAQRKFEHAWGLPLDSKPGLTVVEIMDAIYGEQIRGLYVMGENPAMSDPDVNHARAALAKLDMLVVQDIFLTETAYLADVILPASAFAEKDGSFTNTDRLVQVGRQVLDPPGDARQDLWIIQQMAKQLGLDWGEQTVGEVFDEMRGLMPSLQGISWERLANAGAITYPCESADDPGQPVVFIDRFPRPSGKAKLVPVSLIPAAEQPDADYPMVLITGRQLEHWHTGSMTRRAGVLDAIEPDPVALIHPDELARLGIQPGDLLTLESRRGQVSLYARADRHMPPDTVFVAFCYYEAAINRLTNAVLDPYGKIPEFKFCAIRVQPGGTPPVQSSYGGGQLLAAAQAQGAQQPT